MNIGNYYPLCFGIIFKCRNVGFLRYYTLNNIPNFVLALPFIMFSLKGIFRYFKAVDSILPPFIMLKRREKLIINDNLYPFVILWIVLLFYTAAMMHVQVINRFFSSVPPLFWSLALTLADNEKKKKFIVYLFMILSTAISVLFGAFYPPA